MKVNQRRKSVLLSWVVDLISMTSWSLLARGRICARRSTSCWTHVMSGICPSVLSKASGA
ncbi:hypothetical protein PF005_g32708 [Phytophthora fragariae]|uniref:Uncharacterized protein n=1 Tax=Phytophthora fragariae TaxID=53985 RepID=A0A6A3V315_9STRA|nr:hypothetical protein PF007_g28562 [Phytophthora fragariae]KAE9157775.1 hypothetical protein PF005_g32708 [Phytophthora fragariae]KAE9162751.1 hypothetical protein PF002_g32027 [Phytophthora fragariae]KAE9258672.1 hypothetical protein PF001_g33285 [Phytophthora fragariae]